MSTVDYQTWCDPTALDDLAVLSDSALDACASRAVGVVRLPAQGMLNRTYLVDERPQRVVRFRRDDKAPEVVAYWRGMLGGRLGEDLTIERLSVEAEAARFARWRSLGVLVPATIATGAGWISHTHVDGTVLNRASEQQRAGAAPALLAALGRLHEAGLAAIDRGHGNEILTPDGRVVLIDAELACTGPAEMVRAVDLVTALRGWLRLSPAPASMAAQLRTSVRRALDSGLYGSVQVSIVCEAIDAWYASSEAHGRSREAQVGRALSALLTRP